MTSPSIGPLSLHASIENWALSAPFRIWGKTWEDVEFLLLELEHRGHRAKAEAAGVYYRGETAASMLQQTQSIRAAVEAGLSRDTLQELLPPGGARNAIDWALWCLEARLAQTTVWELCGIRKPEPLVTTFTCGADTPTQMADTARGYTGARALKLKLTGEPEDKDRVLAVREAAPEVWLGVDANQGFSLASLEQLMPTLVQCRVSLIEQPFPLGLDSLLDGLRSPIPIAADESVQSADDIKRLIGRFNVVNIKLDKCGGMTNALRMLAMCRDAGLTSMVGNMLGTSLAMAPAYLLGQQCDIVDLDGPVFLKSDREPRVQYVDGYVECPGDLFE
jgi:L-Ala-D/L-Glu epimerase